MSSEQNNKILSLAELIEEEIKEKKVTDSEIQRIEENIQKLKKEVIRLIRKKPATNNSDKSTESQFSMKQ